MMIPKCKFCGSKDTLIKGQAHGPVEMFYDAAGFYIEDSWDRVYVVRSDVVRCADCLKIRRDLICHKNMVELRGDMRPAVAQGE